MTVTAAKVDAMPQANRSFRSILVSLDGSPLAEQALPVASRIAGAVGGKLRLALVHQVPPAPLDPAGAKLFISMELDSKKWERGYLRAQQARLRGEGMALSSAVTLAGPVGPALAQYVREMGVDLVVMATHGRGGLRRAWLGSVADYLVRHLEVPVVLVRPIGPGVAAPPERGQILVPLDGSPLAEEVLRPAATLARALGAELNLVQVVFPVLTVMDQALPLPATYDSKLTESCRASAQDYLDDIVERLQGEGVRATGAAVVGWNTVDSLLDIARPERVSLIAIATHGRGGLRRLALGSVADKLIRAADVPVLVHRPAGRGKAKSRVTVGGGRAATGRNR